MTEEGFITSEIKQYWPELTKIAKRYVGRFGAELDDLVQEGAIFVWQSLQKGITPSDEHIRNRMRNWCRTLEYQTRYTRARPETREEPEYDMRAIGGFDNDPSEDY